MRKERILAQLILLRKLLSLMVFLEREKYCHQLIMLQVLLKKMTMQKMI